jgi:tetratricopeptide (TPR) repeat protein
MYYDTGDLESAAKSCREALRLDPGFAFAYLTLGNICLDQEKPREALQAFQEFLMRERSPAAKEVRDEVAAVVEGLKAEL